MSHGAHRSGHDVRHYDLRCACDGAGVLTQALSPFDRLRMKGLRSVRSYQRPHGEHVEPRGVCEWLLAMMHFQHPSPPRRKARRLKGTNEPRSVRHFNPFVFVWKRITLLGDGICDADNLIPLPECLMETSAAVPFVLVILQLFHRRTTRRRSTALVVMVE